MAIHAPPPSIVGADAIHGLKDAFDRLDRALVEALQGAVSAGANRGGRELALARTNLEQASMWASKAICIAYPDDQEAK